MKSLRHYVTMHAQWSIALSLLLLIATVSPLMEAHEAAEKGVCSELVCSACGSPVDDALLPHPVAMPTPTAAHQDPASGTAQRPRYILPWSVRARAPPLT